MIPGSLPTKKVPTKSFASPPPKERISTLSMLKKVEAAQAEASTVTTAPKHCYKSFDDLCHRVITLKLENWVVNVKSSIVNLCKNVADYMIPQFEIHIQPSLLYSIRSYAWSLPETHILYESCGRNLKNITVSNLVRTIEGFTLCTGIKMFTNDIIPHVLPKVYDVNNSAPVQQIVYYRTKACELLIRGGNVDLCRSCASILKKTTTKITTKSVTPAKLKAPISATSSEKLKLTIQMQRNENKRLQGEIEVLRAAIETSSKPVNDDFHSDFQKIFAENLDNNNIPDFMKLFWKEQQNYIGKSRSGVRYHPMVIRYCLKLAAKSPSAYEELRYDEKTGTGILVLPSKRRLRDYRNYIKPERGFNSKIIDELCTKTQSFTDIERNVILTFDEMKIQDGLVWDKHGSDLIGYVDLGDEELNFATLKDVEDIATHVLVFLIRGLINPFKFTLANFATTSATAMQIFPLFWKAVGILELKCHLYVIATSCDGMSSNRCFFEMHHFFAPQETITHKVINQFCTSRYIYFIADPPHLMKTARNCLLKSGASHGSRYMWNDGLHILWSHISRFYYEDSSTGLHYLPKLTNDHIQLNSYSVMNVRLAVQVLSDTVGNVLMKYGPPDAAKTAEFCLMMDKFFDCTNVRNRVECELKPLSTTSTMTVSEPLPLAKTTMKAKTRKLKPFLRPYESVEDERFEWLNDVFLKYLSSWKDNVMNRDGVYQKGERANMFLSYQTYQGLQITSLSLIGAVKYLLNSGAKYVLTERFCQDVLENYFGRQRAIGGRKDNPNLRDFGYGDNTIRNTVATKSIQGNSSGNQLGLGELNKIDSTPVPCRKRKRK